MTHLMETAETKLDTATAFSHVGDFANIDRWDPGVNRSVKRPGSPTGVGAVFDLDLDYNGREMKMTYTVTEFEQDKMVVLEGTGSRVRAVDTITFEPNTNGTLVTYEAELSLTGIARLFQPFMRSRFEAIGKAAGEGLREWLRELEG